MSASNGGPAFPHVEGGAFLFDCQEHPGMTLRDWFAGMALQGMLAGTGWNAVCTSHSQASSYAYAFANAMLKQREQP